jgi:hypothetical protein
MTKKLSSSPERGSFQSNIYKKRLESAPSEDTHTQKIIDFYANELILRRESEQTEEWAYNNMEHDMRSTDWFVEKVRASEDYAQHVYAAICGQDWKKLEVMTILKNETWGCSLRSAGGIVADLRGSGDYTDWYCSGRAVDYEGNLNSSFVPEGTVTDEVRDDLYQLGWIPDNFDD